MRATYAPSRGAGAAPGIINGKHRGNVLGQQGQPGRARQLIPDLVDQNLSQCGSSQRSNARPPAMGSGHRDVVLDASVPLAFPSRRTTLDQGYRVTSRRLGRNLEEDLSFTRDGIRDFRVHDLGDAQGQRVPIQVVVEHGIARPEKEAAHWLCDRIGAESPPGWIDWAKEGDAVRSTADVP